MNKNTNLNEQTNEQTNARRKRLRARKCGNRSRQLCRGPVLRFSPTAWAKLLYFCHRGDTEIGGFGITSPADLLRIEQFATVKQNVSAVTVAFDDDAVADFFDQQVEQGRRPEHFARIWTHTHPGTSPIPSTTDELTFDRVFGGCDWAVMFILARGGATYARLRLNRPPQLELVLPVEVDYTQPFAGSDEPAWEQEYQQHVKTCQGTEIDAFTQVEAWDLDDRWHDELAKMEQRRQILLEGGAL